MISRNPGTRLSTPPMLVATTVLILLGASPPALSMHHHHHRHHHHYLGADDDDFLQLQLQPPPPPLTPHPSHQTEEPKTVATPPETTHLRPRAFIFPPLSDTKPKGWLQTQSRIQADTLGGHLEYFFVNNSLWMKDYANLSTVPYPQKDLETVPYWLNGILPLAYQLNDTFLLNVSHTYISAILDRQEPDGWCGPDVPNIKCTIGCRSPWPRYRLLTVLASYAELFPEESQRTIDAMHRLVHSLAHELTTITAAQQLKFSDPWTHARWFELSANIQVLIDADPSNEFGDRAALFDAMTLARTSGLDWATWYTQRLCTTPPPANVSHCAKFQNASSCNVNPGCQFVDRLSCKALDTDCFPCRDAESKGCPLAAEEYFCNHGVNVAQSLKFWAVEGRVEGALNNHTSVDTPAQLANKTIARMHHCHGQPGGVFSGHEQIGGIEPNRGTETCDVVEVMNSYADLFAAFGNTEYHLQNMDNEIFPILLSYLDRIESAGFNRLPAPYLNGSMWSMQYFHKTNAIGGCNAYGLPFECCVANGNQGWPRFTSHLYGLPAPSIGQPSYSLAALLYAPSTLDTVLPSATAASNDDDSDSRDNTRPLSAILLNQQRHQPGEDSASRGNRVQVKLDTAYPFEDLLRFSVSAESAFRFQLRIPRWASTTATIAMPGREETAALPMTDGFYPLDLPAGPSNFTLRFPMTVRVEAEQAGGVSIHAGALLFALDLDPSEHTTGPGGCYYPPDGCHIAPLQPRVDWRQGLLLDSSQGASGGLTLERTSAPSNSSAPFNRASVGLRIVAKAVSIPNSSWPTVNCTSMESGCHDCVGPIPSIDAADVSTNSSHTVTLIPFGATDIRMAVLPVVNDWQ